MSMIALEGVSRSFGGKRVVDNVSLNVASHARISILGPSGSGKTTLLRLIAGLEMPDEGIISLGGRIVSGRNIFVPPYERRIGFVFQSAALWPHMTVAGNILFAIRDLPVTEQRQRLVNLLGRMGIAPLEHRYPGQISGGEARRVALARALAPRPEILLFDEPLTSLDRPLREDLLRLIADSVRENGSTMIYVTHDEHEADVVADTVLHFEAGTIRK